MKPGDRVITIRNISNFLGLKAIPCGSVGEVIEASESTGFKVKFGPESDEIRWASHFEIRLFTGLEILFEVMDAKKSLTDGS